MHTYSRTTGLATLALGLSLMSACGPAQDAASSPELEQSEHRLLPAACTSNAGKWQHLANLAVATADEMGELNPAEQFTVVAVAGEERVALSSYGQSVCQARGGCPMVEELLGLQSLPNDVYVSQAIFNTIDYRLSLVAMYRQQVQQIAQFVANRRFDLLPEDHATVLVGQDGTAMCGTPWYAFRASRDFHFKWSSAGPIAGMTCTKISEPSDGNGWSDNYLCSERNLGLVWSSSGAVAGMSCTNIVEPNDANGWSDNYLCSPEALGLVWSSSGPVAGRKCLQWTEPNDGNGWLDNHLCWDPSAPLLHPSTLCQELWMFGGATSCGGNNPYLDFAVSSDGSRFKLDPTDYNSGGITTTTSGSCVTSLPYTSSTYSVGKCCYYHGVYGELARVTSRPNTYYCDI